MSYSPATSSPLSQPLASPPPPAFSPALEQALKEISPSDDPLDSPEFDPIAYINSNFPDESSLVNGKLDSFLHNLKRRVAGLDESIVKDVREHSATRSQTKQAIASASTAINELFSKIHAIKDKAAQSELMVQEICRDIRSLDAAKKHLTNTIKALRNLHMLVSAVAQLDIMVADNQYRDAAGLLKAISDLFTLFDRYRDVAKIRALHESVENTKAMLKDQLSTEFHRLLPSPLVSQEPHCSSLSDACAVVDVLDSGFKLDLLNWFCNYQLEEYIALYSYGKEGATIDQIERRYAWLRRLLSSYNERYIRVFPSAWDVPIALTKEFCRLTKSHIGKILNATVGRFDVSVMIKSLQKTIEFERELNIRFRRSEGAASGQGGERKERGGDDDEEEDEEAVQEKAVEAIKAKYQPKPAAADPAKKPPAPAAPGDAAAAVAVDFSGSISDVFTPYMSSYVEMERKSINDVLDRLAATEKWLSPEESKTKDRFEGSDELFLYIKNSITRCSKLTRNITFFHLFQEYKSGLSRYVSLLESNLPRKGEGATLSGQEIVSVCFVINTAEYCHDTVPALEENIRQRIEEQFKAQVDLKGLQEEFSVLINQAVQVLVASLWLKLNRILTEMVKLPWATWPSVGDESPYVAKIQQTLREEMPLVSAKLSTKYHNFFCNQVASTFIPRYVESIYRCRRIGEMGAQQLSLDAHALKTILLQVPLMSSAHGLTGSQGGGDGASKPKAASKTYIKYVQTEMSKAEALVKTLVSPNERLIVTFKALLPKSTIDDLMRIMALRGLKRAEQQVLVEAYNATVGAEDQLKLKKETATGSNFKSFISALGTN